MTNKIIRLHFIHSKLFQEEKKLLEILQEKFNIEIVDDNPDYVIGLPLRPMQQWKYPNAIKIMFYGENLVPDFNVCDYAFGFDFMTFGDRYMRLPLYCLRTDYDKLIAINKADLDFQTLANRKFCCFVVSNGNRADPIRTDFFHALCQYKKVDSAGRYLNNMGGGYLEDKVSFVSEYKFNIAFESSSVDGYTTEKIMEPMAVNTIPIYWGNRLLKMDFNPDSVVNLCDYDSIKDCIDYIKALDTNKELYIEKLREPWLLEKQNYKNYKQLIWDFFDNIFSQPKEKAFRTSDYGYQQYYRWQLNRAYEILPHSRQLERYLHLKEKVKKIWQK